MMTMDAADLWFRPPALLTHTTHDPDAFGALPAPQPGAMFIYPKLLRRCQLCVPRRFLQ